MKHLSILIALLIVAITTSTGVFAFFELDEKFTGKPTKTILPDGRTHIKFDEKKHEPFPKDAVLPSHVRTGMTSFTDDEDQDASSTDNKHFSVHGSIIMKSHWELFELDEHSDASKLVCHDRGDKNVRVSIFGASAKLVDYLKNKKESVIIQASANKHICHGDPIFRIVLEAHFFDSEILLVTAKGSYEDLFDEADVGFELEHPQLTHTRSDREIVFPSTPSDHGVRPKDTRGFSSATTVRSSTFGSDAVPAKTDRMHPQDLTSLASEEVESSSRSAEKKGWFKKLKKKVKKAVKKVVKRVKKAVSKVVSAVSKGIQALKAKLAQLTTVDKSITKPGVNVDKQITRSLKGVKFDADFSFKSSFHFRIYIKAAKLQILHLSARGTLSFGGAAQLPARSWPFSAQSALWDIQGAKVEFKIMGIKLWIQYSTSALAGVTANAGASASAGFRAEGYQIFGTEWTTGRGFQPLSNRWFKRTHSLKYAGNFDATPELTAMGKFQLTSLAQGSSQMSIGLDAMATTSNSRCSALKLYAGFILQLSASLSIELKVTLLGKDIKIYSKNYPTKTIADYKYTLLNVCRQKRSRLQQAADAALALPSSASSAENAHLTALENAKSLPEYNFDGTPVLRGAAELSSDTTPITALDEDDSGKAWNSNFTCSSNPGISYDVGLTGFFDDSVGNESTVFFVTITRNITITPEANSSVDYTLTTQSALAYGGFAPIRGSNQRYDILAPTAANAEAIGLDFDDISSLSQSFTDNYTNTLNITWLQITFDQNDMAKLEVYNPTLCPVSKKADTKDDSATEPAAPPEGSYFGRMFADFGKSLFPAFIRLITDVLVVVLILAAIEFIVAYLAPRIIGHEHWPKTATTPRTREWVYTAVGMSVGFICMVIFIVGANVTFAEITGAQLAPNFTVPVQNQGESSYLTASGVQTIVWKFNGANIELNKCPQYYPCSPDCRDLCAKQERSWTNAPWPYCPDTAVETDNGGCTKFAWDAVLNAIFFCVFLFILPVVFMKKCDTIYRRQICLHASLMLAGMFLNLLWRRMDSFMKEVEIQMFDPADEMILPFDLEINPTSNDTWKTAITLYWIMVGLISVGCGYDMYLFRKDTLEGKITRFDDGFESDGVEAKTYKNADSNSAPAPVSRSDFARDVAADLANLNEGETKKVNEGELALM